MPNRANAPGMDAIDFVEEKLGGLSVDAYEIYCVQSHVFSCQANGGAIEMSSESDEQGLALRIFQKGRSAFAWTSHWENAALEKMMRLAAESLPFLPEGPDGNLTGILPLPQKSEKEFKTKPQSAIPAAEKIEKVLQMEKEAKDYDKRITQVRDARYWEETKKVTIKNSRGLSRHGLATRYQLSLMVMAEGGGASKKDKQTAWEEVFSPSFEDLLPAPIGREAAEKAVSQLGAESLRTQKSLVVLDAVVGALFLGVLSSSFLGDQVQKNKSALRDRMGEEIYSPKISFTDDGTLIQKQAGYASFPFDGEGVPTSRNELVVSGRLKSFLYDTFWASVATGREKGLAIQSTGNSIRSSLKEPPKVGSTNFFIEKGDASLEELFSEMGTGFWVRDVIGVHTADAVTGDFSVGASGIWVENGRKAKPVRGVTLSGNFHDLFRKVLRVGHEVRFYQGYGAPPLLVGEIDIGGT